MAAPADTQHRRAVALRVVVAACALGLTQGSVGLALGGLATAWVIAGALGRPVAPRVIVREVTLPAPPPPPPDTTRAEAAEAALADARQALAREAAERASTERRFDLLRALVIDPAAVNTLAAEHDPEERDRLARRLGVTARPTLRDEISRLLSDGVRADAEGTLSLREVDLLERLISQGDLPRLRGFARALRHAGSRTWLGALRLAARSAAERAGRSVIVHTELGIPRLATDEHPEVFEALVDVVLNAVEHGIEGPDERLASGKEAAGNVWVRLVVDGDRATFEVRDDGRGVDAWGLRRQATGDADLTDLCLSRGRGHGLWRLHRHLERLGGRLNVETWPWDGSRVRVELPAHVLSGAAAPRPRPTLVRPVESAAG